MKSFVNGALPLIMLVMIAVVFILIIYDRIAKDRYFICPNCGDRFKASAKQLMVALHVFDEDYLKCPNCGEKAYMKEMKKK